MNIMRHNGISSLSEMRRLYDLSSPSLSSLEENTFNMQPQAPVYKKGGEKKKSTNKFISNIIRRKLFGDLSNEEVRQKLYDNIYPFGYKDGPTGPVERVRSAINGNQEESIKLMGYPAERDAIFATYLGIPEDKRHKVDDVSTIEESPYKPTIGRENDKYYKIGNLNKTELRAFVEDAEQVPIGKVSDHSPLSRYFGNHTISHGVDPQKGDYVSYYDLWDLNPFSGQNKILMTLPERAAEQLLTKGNNEDLSLGIGTPINFYDRVYLDDYYGVNSRPQNPDELYGGYITPSISFAYESGGNKRRKETAYARKYREEQEAKARRAIEHPTLSNAFRNDVSSETGDKYYDVINARYHQSMDALRRKGFTYEDAMRLAPLIVTQNIVEGGWRVARPDDNNFGGLRENGRFLKFDSPEEYYDNYLDLLDRKWGASRGTVNNWRTAQNLDDWSRILNREDLNLRSKGLYDAYNREHRDNPVYLYAPEWENSYKSYREHLAGVEPRVNTYLDMVLEENPYTKEMYSAPIEPVAQPNDNFNLSMDQFQKLLESNGEDFAKGGHKIHIKKENRGKFTALKKRTGHSASWFKAHGTPAQKKMAVFALNAKKWKHAHGGIKF